MCIWMVSGSNATWGGTFENVSILVALGVDQNGNREIIGAA